MEILRVSSAEFVLAFPVANHVFNTVKFAELNKSKCLGIHYLVLRDTKYRLGIILGEKEHELCNPFSAPFGGFVSNRNERIEYFDEAVQLLKDYSNKVGKIIRFVTTPDIYDLTLFAKTYSAIIRNGGGVAIMDMNYHYILSNFDNFKENIDRQARKNLNKALENEFNFIKLNSKIVDDMRRAYQIIKINREQRGFPLRMSLEDIIQTSSIIDIDFFVCTLNNVDVAAAIIYHVTPDIYQVVYWGDVHDYYSFRVMNYLSYKVFEYYRALNAKILDIGPSTESGNPNYGLCAFKESIGCEVSTKITFMIG